MCAITKCLLYTFLCLAVFCEIDSKAQIPNDGVINIDDTLKGEVIEGSGRSGDDDDVDQEESSGGLEDDEDTPLRRHFDATSPSSMTPGAPRHSGFGRGGGGTDATSFEHGSGEGPQGNHDDVDFHQRGGRERAPSVSPPPPFNPPSSPPAKSHHPNVDERFDRRFFVTSPPPPPTLPPTSPPSSTLALTTTTTRRTFHIDPFVANREGDVDDEDLDRVVVEGSATGGVDKEEESVDSFRDKVLRLPSPTPSVDDSRKKLLDPKDYPDESVVDDDKSSWSSSTTGSDGDDDDDKERGSGVIDSASKESEENESAEEVSKPPPHSSKKPKKPDPTKFVTHFNVGENTNKPGKSNYDEDQNKIHHTGGTGYDGKNGEDTYEMDNGIPSIGKAVMGPKQQRNDSGPWAQPGILAGIIGAAVVGLLCAVLLVMFIVYRMRKKDEGSYDLDETTKRSPRINGYQRTNQNEFYA